MTSATTEPTPIAAPAPPLLDVFDFKDHLDSVDAHEKKLPEMSDVDLLAEANACRNRIHENRAAVAKALAETVVLMHRAGRATCILSTRHRETHDLWSFILTLLQPATIEDLVRCHEIQSKHYDVRAIADMNTNQLFRAAMVWPNKKTEGQ